jgi:hypothetical protein
VKRLLAILLSIPAVAAGVQQDNGVLVKYADVQFFKVRETRLSPIVTLELSGLAFHSSLAVDNIETKVSGDCLDVLVHLVPARQGLRGDFTYDVDVPEKVDAVCFGADRKIIWRRHKE